VLHTHEPVPSGGICIAHQNARQTRTHQARPGFDGVSAKVAGRYHGTPLHLFDEVNPVDPTSANSGNPNEGLVENDIKSTLRAFEDEYRDGAED
jgi:hypothetical protein